MKSAELQNLMWRAKQCPRYLGRTGLAGLALLVLALGWAGNRLPDGYARLSDLQRNTASLHERLQRVAGSFDNAALTPQEQLTNFYSAFPDRRTVSDHLEGLYRTAAVHGVTLSQGEYRAKRESEGMLVRYQIALPVSGHYLSVRKFLNESLKLNPFLALDNVSVQRNKINDTTVEARLQLTLYLIEGS
jgi:Tfp pilus assembly protein PilO